MKKCVFILCLILIFSYLPCFAQNQTPSTQELLQQIQILKQKLAELEKKVQQQEKEIKEAKLKKEEAKKENTTPLTNAVTSALKDVKLNLGASAGYFYANHSGYDTKNDKFIVSNFLVELNYEPKDLPVSFSGAYGGTATPSLFDAPQDADSQPTFDIEYADFSVKPLKFFTLEMGLLCPVAGYEDTYTFNNKNITVGALASQQPYNAYGARATVSVKGLFDVYAGYYENRKDDDEYAIELPSGKIVRADDSWEAGITGSFWDTDYTLYYYNLNNMKKLAGFVLEKTVKNVYLALNVDYWDWNDKWEKVFGDDSSIGGALYISPKFKNFEFPLRIEYINQGDSRIYVDSTDADDIFAITLTPTYHFSDNAYFRIEGSYINADNSFEDDSGHLKDYRYYLSAEMGIKF